MNTKAASILSIALLALASLPAHAETRRDQFDADRIERRLEAQGLDIDRVEEWNGLVRAFERNADGTISMRYFSRDTLQPVEI